MAKIIEFTSSRGEKAQKAHLRRAARWGIEDMANYTVKPIYFVYDGPIETDKDTVVSLFRSVTDGRAYVRTDWLDDAVVRYNELVNYDEIRLLHPEVIDELVGNAVKIYNHYHRTKQSHIRRNNAANFKVL